MSRGTLSDNAFCKQWPLENIKETLPRWFGLRDCALEMFMADGQAEMLAFETTVKRDGIINLINSSLQTGSSGGASGKGTDQGLLDLQQKWRKGEITNFCYLMELNKGWVLYS